MFLTGSKWLSSISIPALIVGKISGLNDVHGVAIAREFGRGFIDATDPGSVTIFDLKTLAVIDKIRVGDDPNGIIYDPKTKRIFTADRGSKRLSAIDAKTGKVVAQADNLGGRTEHWLQMKPATSSSICRIATPR